MSVRIDMVYEGDLHCQAKHGPSGQALVTDAPVDNGGKGQAFSPTDLVAAATGTCMLTIMGLVARRSNLDITGTRATVIKEMTAEGVRRVAALKVTVTVPNGSKLSPADRAKLEGGARLCPVKQSLHPDVDVQMQFVYEE